MWKCGVCNYIHEGGEAPEKCPKCGSPKEKFAALGEEKETLVLRSRYTNSLHMELAGLLEQMMNIAEEGIEDNLDPSCVNIFTKAKAEAKVLQQMVKSEIEGHVGKGKWG